MWKGETQGHVSIHFLCHLWGCNKHGVWQRWRTNKGRKALNEKGFAVLRTKNPKQTKPNYKQNNKTSQIIKQTNKAPTKEKPKQTKPNPKQNPHNSQEEKISGPICLATLIVMKRESVGWLEVTWIHTPQFHKNPPGMSDSSSWYRGSKFVIHNCVLCHDRWHKCKCSCQKGSPNVNMTSAKGRDGAE